METAYLHNIRECLQIAADNMGPSDTILVSGSPNDSSYWRRRIEKTKSCLFRHDDSTRVRSIAETTPKGNFLGTLHAYGSLDCLTGNRGSLHSVSLISMLFGKGTRLSPFTQALGNCKPRFLTPLHVNRLGIYLTIAELAALYSNLLVKHLRVSGFRGSLVKWGDEIFLPSRPWRQDDLTDVDALRFVWFTEPTDELATQKEWIATTPEGTMLAQFPRQDLTSLMSRIRHFNRSQAHEVKLGVNLGSLGISHDFLQVASTIFAQDIADPAKSADWDPYVWVALSCKTREDWLKERQLEQDRGDTGIAVLEERFPDFFEKVRILRATLENMKGRPLTIKAIDFGSVFWVDFGLHYRLREILELTRSREPSGNIVRALFQIPNTFDANSNILINAQVPATARIRNSLVMDTVITGKNSIAESAVLIGSRHDTVELPRGGMSLFSDIGHLRVLGPRAIAFHSIAERLTLPEYGRHSTVATKDRLVQLLSDERITDYRGSNYTSRILGNQLSFSEAASLVDGVDFTELEQFRRTPRYSSDSSLG